MVQAREEGLPVNIRAARRRRSTGSAGGLCLRRLKQPIGACGARRASSRSCSRDDDDGIGIGVEDAAMAGPAPSAGEATPRRGSAHRAVSGAGETSASRAPSRSSSAVTRRRGDNELSLLLTHAASTRWTSILHGYHDADASPTRLAAMRRAGDR